MRDQIPGVWAFVLIAAASYRVFHLIAEDVILDRPRRMLLRLGGWQEPEQPPPGYRAKLGEFITCAWCAGAWISGAWWLAWLIWEEWAVVVAVPFALSAGVAFLNAMMGAMTEE